MSVLLDINKPFIIDYLFFSDILQNNIKNDSLFSRIIYSNNRLSLKNLYFMIQLDVTSFIETNAKLIISFDGYSQELLKLYDLEKCILDEFQKSKGKVYIPSYGIYEQCRQGSLRLFNSHHTKIKTNKLTIKISGIWETGKVIGLTYKLI